MTTVAYRDGILAADTLISYGTFTNGNVNKIHVVDTPTGRVMCVLSGVCWAIQPMLAWLEEGSTQETIPHNLLTHCTEFSCLIVNDQGSLFEFNNGYFIECGVEYHSIGSGAQFALGAMAAGVSAPNAVSAAMKHDKASGGNVTICTVATLLLKEAA